MYPLASIEALKLGIFRVSNAVTNALPLVPDSVALYYFSEIKELMMTEEFTMMTEEFTNSENYENHIFMIENILNSSKLELNKIFDTRDIIKKNDFDKILIYLDNQKQKFNLGKYLYLLVGMIDNIENIMISDDGISFFKWLFKNEKLSNWTCDTFLPISLRL